MILHSLIDFTFPNREHKTFWGGRKESSFPDLYLPRYDEIFKVFDGLPTFDCMCLQEYWFNNDIAELFEKRIGDRWVIKFEFRG